MLNNNNPNELSTFSVNNFNDKEQEQIKNLINSIDFSNINAMIQYGLDIQNKIGRFSETLLNNTKNFDTNNITEALHNLSTEIRSFSNKTEEKKGFFKFFDNLDTKEKIIEEYSKTKINLLLIERDLQSNKRQLMKNISILSKMLEENNKHTQEINYYVVAGKEKINEAQKITIPDLEKNAETTNDDVYKLKIVDFKNNLEKFENKIHDLNVSRMVSMQTSAQINLLINSEETLLSKINFSLDTSIPLWKNQISILLGLEKSERILRTNLNLENLTKEETQKNNAKIKSSLDKKDIDNVNNELLNSIDEIINITKENDKEIEQNISKLE